MTSHAPESISTAIRLLPPAPPRRPATRDARVERPEAPSGVPVPVCAPRQADRPARRATPPASLRRPARPSPHRPRSPAPATGSPTPPAPAATAHRPAPAADARPRPAAPTPAPAPAPIAPPGPTARRHRRSTIARAAIFRASPSRISVTSNASRPPASIASPTSSAAIDGGSVSSSVSPPAPISARSAAARAPDDRAPAPSPAPAATPAVDADRRHRAGEIAALAVGIAQRHRPHRRRRIGPPPR